MPAMPKPNDYLKNRMPFLIDKFMRMQDCPIIEAPKRDCQ